MFIAQSRVRVTAEMRADEGRKAGGALSYDRHLKYARRIALQCYLYLADRRPVQCNMQMSVGVHPA